MSIQGGKLIPVMASINFEWLLFAGTICCNALGICAFDERALSLSSWGKSKNLWSIVNRVDYIMTTVGLPIAAWTSQSVGLLGAGRMFAFCVKYDSAPFVQYHEIYIRAATAPESIKFRKMYGEELKDWAIISKQKTWKYGFQV